MDKRNNYNISSRYKRCLAQEKTEKDYLLLESLNNSATDFDGPSAECIKKCRIEYKNDQLSILTSPLNIDQKHINQYSSNFSNNDKEEFSDEVHNSLEMITIDEDFVDIEEEKEEMQPLSFESDDSSDDVDDIDVEHNDEDENMDNELLRDLRNWSF